MGELMYKSGAIHLCQMPHGTLQGIQLGGELNAAPFREGAGASWRKESSGRDTHTAHGACIDTHRRSQHPTLGSMQRKPRNVVGSRQGKAVSDGRGYDEMALHELSPSSSSQAHDTGVLFQGFSIMRN